MPKTKNQAKNKSRFEVRGGLLNEFEFARNEGAIAQEERNRLTQADEAREGERAPASPQEAEAARIREVIETAHEKAQRNLEKRERQSAAGGVQKRGRTRAAKKGAAKRASKSGASKKAVGKKAGSKKSASKKSSGKKGRSGVAKKAGARKSAAKRGSTKKASAKKSRGRTR